MTRSDVSLKHVKSKTHYECFNPLWKSFVAAGLNHWRSFFPSSFGCLVRSLSLLPDKRTAGRNNKQWRKTDSPLNKEHDDKSEKYSLLCTSNSGIYVWTTYSVKNNLHVIVIEVNIWYFCKAGINWRRHCFWLLNCTLTNVGTNNFGTSSTQVITV